MPWKQTNRRAHRTGCHRTRWLALVCAIFASSVSAQPAATPGESATPRRFVRVPAPDGIQIRRYNQTNGAKPTKYSRIVVEYVGTLDDGTVFDRTFPNSPAPFPMKKVIPCWKKALPLLRAGEKAQIRCPAPTAYGYEGSPPEIPSNARLTFEIEIVGVH